MILLTVGVVFALAIRAYLLQVYAPGLRAEAASIPARVRAQLAQHGAPYAPLASIAPFMREAIVAIEDRRFYQHSGIDPVATLRAAWVNLWNKRVDQGGSTLEEQLVKRAIVHDDRTLRGKLRTMALAWATDQDFSKPEVLELYLNEAYYGQGAYGIQSAAQTYFGTDANNLTLPQAAFLAALPQAPSIYGSRPRSAIVTARVDAVLADMEQLQYITAAQVQVAEATSPRLALPNP